MIHGDDFAGLAAACAAAACFDGAIAFQALEARDIPRDRALSLSLLARLIRRPRWALATGMAILGWPFQLLALSLPHAPLTRSCATGALARSLLTPLGLRSLAPGSPGYRGGHRGGPRDRDSAYHQGTVWPWLIGPYVDACRRVGVHTDGVLAGLVAHLAEWGLGSVSETADGEPPHAATGCPFQAWSVAELLRVLRLPAVSERLHKRSAGEWWEVALPC